MNPKTTWFLLALALGLGSYLFLVERHNANPAQSARENSLLFPDLSPDAIDRIEITRTNHLRIRAERTGAQWRLTSPVNYPAQSSSIDNFLGALQALPKLTHITPREIAAQPNTRTALGLESPEATVSLFQNTNRIQFVIGSKTLVGNQVYLQRLGEAGVSVTDGRLLQLLPQSILDWRYPLILSQPRLLFDRLFITNGSSVISVQLDETNQLWQLVRPLRAAADSRVVTYLIQELRNTRVHQFVSDDPKTDVEPFGLNPPSLDLALAQGSNTVFQIQFGNPSTNNPNLVYARLLNHSNVVLIPKELSDFLRAEHTYFRDRQLISAPLTRVGRIEIQARDRFALQRSASNTWSIVEPFQAPADPNSVQHLLDNLGRLEIVDFPQDVVTDFAPFGLSPPTRRYSLLASSTNAAHSLTNQILAQIDFGTTTEDKIFARRGDQQSLYTVSVFESSRLPQAAFELRHRRLWNFIPDQVVALSVQLGPETRKLNRAPDGSWASDPILNAALLDTVQRLAELHAVDWVARGQERLAAHGFLDSPRQITLHVASGAKIDPYTIEFGKPALSGHRYAAVLLENNQKIIFRFPIAEYSLIDQYLFNPPKPGAAQPQAPAAPKSPTSG